MKKAIFVISLILMFSYYMFAESNENEVRISDNRETFSYLSFLCDPNWPWPGYDRTRDSQRALCERITKLEEKVDNIINKFNKGLFINLFDDLKSDADECRDITPEEWGTAITIPDDDTIVITDAVIRWLVESGRICEILGHKWECEDFLERIIHGDGNSETETCLICGKTRTRHRQPEWGEWE